MGGGSVVGGESVVGGASVVGMGGGGGELSFSFLGVGTFFLIFRTDFSALHRPPHAPCAVLYYVPSEPPVAPHAHTLAMSAVDSPFYSAPTAAVFCPTPVEAWFPTSIKIHLSMTDGQRSRIITSFLFLLWLRLLALLS